MLRIWNCYLPLSALKLSELTAGTSQIFLLSLLALIVGRWHTLNAIPALMAYVAGMCYIQRRLASGLPLRYSSLRSWRCSSSNFRRTSQFKRHALEGCDAHTNKIRPYAVITGGERGIGFHVAQQLALEGFELILCCPFVAEAQRAVEKIEKSIARRQARGSKEGEQQRSCSKRCDCVQPVVHFIELNLADEASVRKCAESIAVLTPRVHILINNAGILSYSGATRHTNSRGDELVVAVNFLGPVLLTELLLARGVFNGGASRIINVSSLMMLDACVPRGWTALDALRLNCSGQLSLSCEHDRADAGMENGNYSLSKLLLVCYTRDLALRLHGSGITVATLHPGVVFTAIYDHWGVWSHLMRWVMRTVFKFPGEGAEVVLFCALADGISEGSFYADCKCRDSVVSPLAGNVELSAEITKFVKKHFCL